MSDRAQHLATTSWLQENLDAVDIVIIDATWHMPASGRDAAAEYAAAHIPGAIFFDIDAIADTASSLPHMLPDQVSFANHMRRLGISERSRIVVYDSYGIFSAPRVWWTLRIMGAPEVLVLDGGLKKWLQEERPVEDTPTRRAPHQFSARLNRAGVRDLKAMQRIINEGKRQIIDARSSGRFAGLDAEPRPELPSGHMRGAYNLPFDALIDENGCLRDDRALRKAFDDAGIDLARPVVTTCGSGITAAVLNLALAVLGHTDVALYDGSWTEWAGRVDTEIMGPAGLIRAR